MSHAEYDVVVALDYYAPYVSGVTEAARVTAEGLAARGLRVLVVASHHDPSTPVREVINGVDVLRTRVIARIGKGVVTPALVSTAIRYGRKARLLHLHLPMLESGLIAALVRRVPIVTTYQCDVALPPGLLNRVQTWALDLSHKVALRRAAAVMVTSDDYAKSSRRWADMRGKTVSLPAPAVDRSGGEPSFRRTAGLHVGFVGRIVEEKGIEYLVDAFRGIEDPDARLLIAGDHSKVAGGSVIDRVTAHIGSDRRIEVLGFVADEQLADFYASIDVFALPSISSLEAFGIVQVEAMMQGVPVVASDRPGVRMPVLDTGFGLVVPARDADALRRALLEIGTMDLDRVAATADARARYSADAVVARVHAEFDRLWSR